MDKLLIAFGKNINNREEWEKILNKFDDEDYFIYEVGGIDTDNFDIGKLPELIEYYRTEHKLVNKIAIISNIRDLIFSWFRCFHTLVDNYIYFIDKKEYNFYRSNDQLSQFIRSLSGFSNIDQDLLTNPLYMNINYENYKNMFLFLCENNNFKNIESLDNYDYGMGNSNSTICKLANNYIFNGYEYCFEDGEEKKKSIKLTGDEQENSGVLGSISAIDLEKKAYFIPYVLLESFNYKNIDLIHSLITLLKRVSTTASKEDQEKTIDIILAYVNSKKNISFFENIYYLTLIVILKSNRSLVAEKIVSILNFDDRYTVFHYNLLFNLLFYESNENLLFSNKVYVGMRNEVKKLSKKFVKEQKISLGHNSQKSGVFKIALMTDQLLAIQHAPTLIVLKLAKSFKQFIENVEIKIFVEDNFISRPEEIGIPYYFSSVRSDSFKEIHNEYLTGLGIDIYYSNSSKDKALRTSEIVEKVNDFEPTVVLTMSDISICREILMPWYPIVYQTFGGVNFSTKCDAYVVYGDSQKRIVLKINQELKFLHEDSIFVNEQPTWFVEQYKKDYTKDALNLHEHAFVFVTVGNRLNAELSSEFIIQITEFLRNNTDTVWLLIGPKKIEYIHEYLSDLIDKKRIVQIAFEEDLPSLYKICDVYLNPPRQGGAGSVAIAMQCGIPVIVEINSQDAVFIVGEENCVANEKEAYLKELQKLYTDKEYRDKRGVLMKEIMLNKSSWQDHINNYLKIFEYASYQYDKRNHISKGI